MQATILKLKYITVGTLLCSAGELSVLNMSIMRHEGYFGFISMVGSEGTKSILSYAMSMCKTFMVASWIASVVNILAFYLHRASTANVG